MATWADVRRIALSLPGTSEGKSSDGKSSWAVGDKGFAWERPLRKSDLAALGDAAPTGPVLGLKTGDLDLKDALIANDPAFFATPHFDGYPAVLVDLRKISVKKLRPAIVEAWLAMAPKRVAAAYLKAK